MAGCQRLVNVKEGEGRSKIVEWYLLRFASNYIHDKIMLGRWHWQSKKDGRTIHKTMGIIAKNGSFLIITGRGKRMSWGRFWPDWVEQWALPPSHLLLSQAIWRIWQHFNWIILIYIFVGGENVSQINVISSTIHLYIGLNSINNSYESQTSVSKFHQILSFASQPNFQLQHLDQRKTMIRTWFDKNTL